MNRNRGMLPELPCLCANFRRASRALTQFYDDALRPTGLRATQFAVLQVLSRAGEITQGALGRILAMDSTTLTRTLDIMERNGWVAKQAGKDRRERRIALAKAGEEQLKRCLPKWEKVQSRLRQQLGDEHWSNLLKSIREVTEMTTQ